MADERRGGKRVRDTTSAFDLDEPAAGSDAGAAAAVAAAAPETGAGEAQHRLSQRQKQIDFGKNSPGYARYTELVPRAKRRKAQPSTPDVHQTCAKRHWDSQVREWRRALHRWDPEELRVHAARNVAALKADAGQAARDLEPTPAPAAKPKTQDCIFGSFEEC